MAGRRCRWTTRWPRCSSGRAWPRATSRTTRTRTTILPPGCTNPTFAYCMTATIGGACTCPVDPRPAATTRLRAPPCTVTVTLTHDFHLLAPLSIDFFGRPARSPHDADLRARQHLRHDRHRRRGPGTDAMTHRTLARPRPLPGTGHGRVRACRPDVLPRPVRDHRGGTVHLLLRDPEQRDPRGRAVRHRQRRQRRPSAARPVRRHPVRRLRRPGQQRRRSCPASRHRRRAAPVTVDADLVSRQRDVAPR